jgi:hypothetical protein
VGVAVLADIVVAAITHGEVYDKVAHQCTRSARERYMPRDTSNHSAVAYQKVLACKIFSSNSSILHDA